ncbi:hypothetical protein J6A31_06585 [bacterium]|nr:hypothetical protein [bacterium]
MTYLIMGRTGSGKDYLINLLTQRGLTDLKSYTTRPKRSENEDSHTFVTTDEATTITDRVAETTINGYEYFATKDQICNADLYVIDPNGLKMLVEKMPDEIFHIIYVEVDDYLTRKCNAVKRADDKISEEAVFEARNADEDSQFTEFEQTITAISANDPTAMLPDNIGCVYRYRNTYDEEYAESYADFLINRKRLHDRLTVMVKESILFEIVAANETLDKAFVKHEDGSQHEVSFEHFADTLINDDKGLSLFMKAFITHSPRFDTK